MIDKHNTEAIFMVGFSKITPTQNSRNTFQKLHTSEQMLVSHIAVVLL